MKFNRNFLKLFLVGSMLILFFSMNAICADEKNFEMVTIVKDLQHPCWLELIVGANKAVKDLGNINMDVVGPVKGYNLEEQLTLMETYIAKGVDAIIITPIDSKGIARGVKKANDAGILIATPNTKALGGDILTYIGVENFEVGYTVGKAFCEVFGVEEANIVFLEGTPGASTSEERKKGFFAAFDEFENVNVLASQTAHYNRTEALQVTENLLQRFDNLNGVAACDTQMALGALEAVRAAGKIGEIKICGFDVCSSDMLTVVAKGEVVLTGDQQFFSQGYLSVLSCWAALNGISIPREQYLPVVTVEQEEAKEYIKIRQELFKTVED